MNVRIEESSSSVTKLRVFTASFFGEIALG